MRSYRVTVDKDYLVFAAGHFITYGGRCESLHGHNYRARVEVEGELDADHYVLDFSVLKRIMRRLVDEIDHRMLLPLHNPHLTLEEVDGGIRVSYGERRYLFPSEDTVLLPIPNTTAEMLASYLAGRLKAELAALDARNLRSLEVEVEESFGQAAAYREELEAGALTPEHAAPPAAERAPA